MKQYTYIQQPFGALVLACEGVVVITSEFLAAGLPLLEYCAHRLIQVPGGSWCVSVARRFALFENLGVGMFGRSFGGRKGKSCCIHVATLRSRAKEIRFWCTLVVILRTPGCIYVNDVWRRLGGCRDMDRCLR